MALPIPHAVTPYALALGLGWMYYRRIRRHIGRQAWQPRRTLVRMAILSLAAAGLVFAAVFVPGAWVGAGVGLGFVAGIASGFIGIASTTVETDERGRWYTPNPWIGGALAILLVARLAWRMLGSGGLREMGRMQASPLTLGIAAALVGYYLTYSFLLMERMRKTTPAQDDSR